MDRQGYQEVPSYTTAEQNTLIEQLQHSVRQTKEHAIHIGNAFGEHNEMLDTLHEQVVAADNEGDAQNRNLGQLLNETSNKHFYTLVLVLVLLILFVMFI